MSRWFRWYEGTTEDGKFRVAARKSRVTVRDVIALWAFMLEDAADVTHRGVCNRDEDFMAGVLDFEDGVVENILQAMESVGLISIEYGSITICNFSKRQFDSDVDSTATERQRRKRARDRSNSNTDVTRDSRTPDTDTDTDITNASALDAAPPVDARAELWSEGVSILSAITGKPPSSAKQLVGKWCRDAKDDCAAVLGKIRQARADRIGDPVPWITAAVRATAPPQERTMGELLRDAASGKWSPPGWTDEPALETSLNSRN